MSPTPAFVDPRDTHMNRSLLVPATILACLLGGALATGCDKKDSSGGPAQALSAKPDPAASAPAQRAAPLKVTGSYEAKAGDVRTPMDAPTFSNVATGALGKGELDPTRAMMTGRLRLSDMGLAMKLQPAIQSLFSKAA